MNLARQISNASRRAAALLLLVVPCFRVSAAPGTALHFDGTNNYVNVANDASLNAFPLTITAWIRTIRNTPLYDGILNKYSPGSANGYSLHVYNGHVYAWYFRNGVNYVYPADPGFDGGYVADGEWHHVALVISQSGGAIYVDGNLNATRSWTGTPGPTTSPAPILLGRYATNSLSFVSSFAGDLDEVTLWNRALTSSEVNYLKHRRLAGKEDGLLGYWRFDEAAGTSANNSATNNFNGTLSPVPPAWIPSQAAIALEPIATNCLKFNGVSGYVSVPHDNTLNAYPLTVTAWFRTTNTANVVHGIVNKYQDGSGNGWALLVQNNRLRGFFYTSLFNSPIDSISAATVADGGWHHAAMVVDASGGRLYLDGVLVGSNTWPGAASAPTSVEPLQIGRYYNYPQHFDGAIDEVTVWNRALTAGEIQTNRNLLLTGGEPNLVAYWRLDEGVGTTATDSSGHGHTGSFVNTPRWIGSTAYLGDGSVHLDASPGIPSWSRTFAVNTAVALIPALSKDSFQVSGRGFLRRFYDFGPTPPSEWVTNYLEATLQTAGTATSVPLKPNTVTNAFTMSAYNASSPQPLFFGSVASLSATITLQPDGVNLDSVNQLYQSAVTLSHTEAGGGLSSDGSLVTDPTRLLHFNGHVMFGNIDVIVTNIANPLVPGANFPPSYIQSQLQLASGGAYLAASPSFTFGGGAAFTVNLGVDGTATNVNGSFSLSAPNQFFEKAGIRYQLPGASLSANGLTADSLLAWFPTGFGFNLHTNNRALRPYATQTNIVIGPDMAPTNATIVFTAASYNTDRLWFAEETKPFLIGASQIEWHIPQGEFFIPTAQSLLFVREEDDRDLSNQAATLVNPLAADRISNDTYYRHIAAVANTPIYVRPDANGAALLSMQATLQENEYRPHFPYIARNAGGHVPVIGGALTISNDVVDTSASYLLLAGPAPVPYARDCPPEAGCSGVPTNGPQVLQFTPPTGHLGLNELSFTPDGGLIAYGSIPPTNLTWGFTSGDKYAQRTSDVQAGVYHVPGTFLTGAATRMANGQRPAILLFTGWGNETNGTQSTYVERPGAPVYDDGFANYAGLNFRRPVQGRSFIADQDSGWYPLTSRSKYYVRYGGVSGIHESATFPPNMTLYGYAFHFDSYRLSYLDSANWESRTDGRITLPVPSGFPVEFERMKFLCRGNLDSARLPPNIGTKHMVYWNTDIKPLTLQFKPKSGDPCSLTTRFLVLGVETKLPFIPQAFQAALAFKTNGNLGNVNTLVEGVDSRFPVPANLNLQGPGGSLYPLTAGAEGYFNNWETPGRPDAGFYNIVGRARVPFFRDVKVQLHVTPLTASTAQIAIMGGWQAEEGSGANRGWTVAGKNYFTQTKFDPNHDGWPGEVTLNDYRNSPDENYRPRAQQNWIDVAFFDYPLAWNSVLREFKGFTPAPVVLPVIDVDSNLKELTPGKVDLDFAQDLNVQLPRIKVLDFANDALNEINSPFNSVSNAIRSALGGALDSSGLTSGFRSLQNVMRENSEGFFRPLVESSLTDVANPVVDKLYAALAAELAVSKANLLNKTAGIVAAGTNGLQNAILNLNGTAGDANKVFGQIDRTFADVDDTLGLFIRVLEKDGSGQRHVVRAIIQKLTQDQGPALGFAVGLADPVVNDLLADLEPTLAEIESELRDLRSQFSQLHAQITGASGDFVSALNAANHTTGTLQTYLQQAGGGVSNLLNSVVGPAGDYFTADPVRAKREIRERLFATFLGSPLPGAYQTAFRQFMYDKNFVLDQLMDVLFDQVNRSIRKGLDSFIAGATDNVFQSMKGSGLMSGSLASAKIRGAPTFEGDSLRKIHLDADVRMHLPDELKFTAYMDIKELNSATTPMSCIPAGAPAAEVTLGAKDIPLEWLGVVAGSPLKLSIEARWTLQSGAVIGIGGAFEVKGKIGFKGCSINNFGASLAFGATENYFAAKAGATVLILGIPVDFDAGIFVGKACSLDPLRFVDPEVQDVLIVDATEFTGLYLQFGGGLSLSEILFGTSSCFLDVSAHVTSALYYQGGAAFGAIGGRQKMGVDVDLICIISASADWAVAMRLDSVGKLTIQGQARLCGKLGYCPFCIKACKSLKVTGVLDDGGIDYDIDF